MQHGEKWKHYDVLSDHEMEYPSPMSNLTSYHDVDSVDLVPETQNIPNILKPLRRRPMGNTKAKMQKGKSPLNKEAQAMTSVMYLINKRLSHKKSKYLCYLTLAKFILQRGECELKLNRKRLLMLLVLFL